MSIKDLRFEWEERKAKTVFYDDAALVIADPDNSETEDRFVILGFSANARILVVCHCYRDNEGVIRIISARKATRNEASHYRRRGKEHEGRIRFQQREDEPLCQATQEAGDD
ncbi:MAG: BrnT family toxin [Bacilli bacterium]|nr:BrnT family toxin [Bacilli bacterium]MBO6286128.1 BrnT family toxin [Bacilli bacterium]